MTARARRACVAGSLLGAGAIALAPGCKKTPTLDFSLSVPSNVASKVAWYEVGVFSGPACGSIGPQLTGGVPETGYLERIAFQAGASAPPIENLTRANYSIAVAARAADCSVLADGCADVDLSSNAAVVVTLYDGPTPALGACVGGTVCDEGRCAPGVTGIGVGCSLALLGAGPLADPLILGGGTIVSAPAIAATDDGFLIAYRENDTGNGIARVTVIPIDEGGGAGAAVQTQQPTCAGAELSDATGLVFSGTSGVVAESRAGCGNSGGVDLYAVANTGAFGKTAFTSEGIPSVRLSTAHALASSSAGTFLAYVESNVATVASVSDLTVGASTPFGGAIQASDAWVAASDGVVALVAASAGSVSPSDDAGGGGAPDDASTGDGGVTDGGVTEAGGTGDDAGGAGDDANAPSAPAGTLLVNVVAASDAGASFASLPAPTAFAGTWASVSAQEGRVFVASDGQTTADPISYRAFDVGTATPTVTGGFTTSDVGPVLYTDVAFHQNHVFFAVERPGAIALVAFDNATTTPTPLRTVELAIDPRVPSLSGVRDGRVAVLATDTLVLVAWTTEESLNFNDATGGYALFACSTP